MDRYLVGPAQLAVLPLELFHPGPLLGREAGPLAAVDLGLVDPLAQGLGADAELARHPGDRPEALTPLAAGLEDHADGPLPELGRVPSLERAAAAVLCHDSMILQAVESPSKSGRFSRAGAGITDAHRHDPGRGIPGGRLTWRRPAPASGMGSASAPASRSSWSCSSRSRRPSWASARPRSSMRRCGIGSGRMRCNRPTTTWGS